MYIYTLVTGSKYLNERVRVEDGALKQQLAPPNYRWSCRTQVGLDPFESGEVQIKLRPQTATW